MRAFTIHSRSSASGKRVRRGSRFQSAFNGWVDEDEGLLAGARGRGEEVRFNAEALEFRTVERRGVILSNFADVARAQAPLLACGHGRSYLPAEQNIRGIHFHL